MTAQDVRSLAITLAKSGRHPDYVAVRDALAAGHPEVYVVLADAEFRDRLNQLCDEHWNSPMNLRRSIWKSEQALARSYGLLRRTFPVLPCKPPEWPANALRAG